MVLSEVIVKIIGIILAVVGLALILSAVGFNFLGGTGLQPVWLGIVVGVIFIGAGIWIIRGGTISL